MAASSLTSLPPWYTQGHLQSILRSNSISKLRCVILVSDSVRGRPQSHVISAKAKVAEAAKQRETSSLSLVEDEQIEEKAGNGVAHNKNVSDDLAKNEKAEVAEKLSSKHSGGKKSKEPKKQKSTTKSGVDAGETEKLKQDENEKAEQDAGNGSVAQQEVEVLEQEQQEALPKDKETVGSIIVQSVAALHAECRAQLDLLGNASDEDVIHDLRVALRRLRSAVNTFCPFIDIPKKAEVRRLSRLLKVLGTVRDADVMQETLNKVKQEAGELLDKESAALEKVQKQMAEERVAMMTDASKALRSKQAWSLLDAWEGWIKDPRYQEETFELIDSDARLVAPSLLLPPATFVYLDAAWHIESVDRQHKAGRSTSNLSAAKHHKGADKEQPSLKSNTMDDKQCARMHDLRKRLRELRYGMEVLAPLYGGRDRYQNSLKSVKELQGALGDLQDLQVLAEYLRRRFPASAPNLAQATVSLQGQIWSKWLESRDLLNTLENQEHLYRALSSARGPKHSSSTEAPSDEREKPAPTNGKADISAEIRPEGSPD